MQYKNKTDRSIHSIHFAPELYNQGAECVPNSQEAFQKNKEADAMDKALTKWKCNNNHDNRSKPDALKSWVEPFING